MMLVIIAGTLAQIAQIILSVRLWAKRTLLCKEKQKFVTLAAIYLCPLTAGVYALFWIGACGDRMRIWWLMSGWEWVHYCRSWLFFPYLIIWIFLGGCCFKK